MTDKHLHTARTGMLKCAYKNMHNDRIVIVSFYPGGYMCKLFFQSV